ncbi:hypothetical protein [Bradyrhizobium sp. ORS 285]|uniref:hypothetical protein n=1 Tax=Bradyrhizobium sp. ORS 285 TaxID=115808 RepID=UPI001111B20E|nr:hypothetical protein [Bradyrhizobium sp. ORS 285]
MDFMGISVGILALVCALVLLFGARGARKLLGWSFGVLIFCAIGLSAVAWIRSSYEMRTQTAAASISGTASPATPISIIAPLPTGFVLDNTPDLADKIRVTGPDKRIFVFSVGTEKTAIESFMRSQYGVQGSRRAECWTKEPGPWCDYR